MNTNRGKGPDFEKLISDKLSIPVETIDIERIHSLQRKAILNEPNIQKGHPDINPFIKQTPKYVQDQRLERTNTFCQQVASGEFRVKVKGNLLGDFYKGMKNFFQNDIKSLYTKIENYFRK